MIFSIMCDNQYKMNLEKKINDVPIDKIKDKENKTTISPKNLKHCYYQPSISSLIEVSSNDDDSDIESECGAYESDNDNYSDINSNCEKMVKTIHMPLDLNNFDDINVKFLNEVSNFSEKTKNLKIDDGSVLDVELEVELEVDELNDDLSNNLKNMTNELRETNELIKVNEEKELNFKQKNKENKKNIEIENYKKMHLSELKKYVFDNKLGFDASKMKKNEILKAIELKENELKENNVGDELKENNVEVVEIKEDEVIL